MILEKMESKLRTKTINETISKNRHRSKRDFRIRFTSVTNVCNWNHIYKFLYSLYRQNVPYLTGTRSAICFNTSFFISFSTHSVDKS